ncbi:hypothetical protein TIFTF001_005069 [Ficus carica]|uniref:Uncharacterized protein n=1 Tax=Ficus carica TaxID=3494 RepID=A0AA88CU65_FICCA|nr:hypothetical protein TIFTF001_005069 [Ficus carica]
MMTELCSLLGVDTRALSHRALRLRREQVRPTVAMQVSEADSVCAHPASDSSLTPEFSFCPISPHLQASALGTNSQFISSANPVNKSTPYPSTTAFPQPPATIPSDEPIDGARSKIDDQLYL